MQFDQFLVILALKIDMDYKLIPIKLDRNRKLWSPKTSIGKHSKGTNKG